MSSEDGWFNRWGKAMPFGPWSYADVEEMMKEMEKDFLDLDTGSKIPNELVRERRAEDGSVSKEFGPIVYGYSVTVGPGGKPVIREFGNIRRGPSKEWKEAISEVREPLVDVVDSEKETRIIAELPGAREHDIELSAEGKRLVISAKTTARRYLKELELPGPVDVAESTLTFNNGILEVTFPKRKGRLAGVRKSH